MCKIRFDRKKPLHNVDPTDKENPESWIYRIVQDKAKNGYVLTRFIDLEPEESGVQEYFCIFERDVLPGEDSDRLQRAIDWHGKKGSE